MMKLVFKILMAIAVLLVLFLIVGMLLPERLQVERSIGIKAGPDRIYPYLSNYRLFRQWSPWARFDPAMQVDYEGPEQGEGAIMHWRSQNEHVGQGSQKIIEASENRSVRSVLAMAGMGKAYSSFELRQERDKTVVTWRFDMHFGYNIPGRIMGLMMDDELAALYEQGLRNLRELVDQQQE